MGNAVFSPMTRPSDLGLGTLYRLGRIDLRAEGRDMIYEFNRFGYKKTQNDIVWQGGVTVRI